MTTDSRDGELVPRRSAHYVLFLLFTLMLFDFIDRQVLAALLPAIKLDWGLADTQLGILVSAVNVAIAVLALPAAMVADRWSRTRAIGTMALVWSFATAACGIAQNYTQLIAARFVVGAGEAGYSSGGNALLAAVYPQRLRSTVIGVFQSGAMVGSVLGVVLGGLIAARWGWQHAFGIVALPGLVFAILIFFVKDYQTVAVQVRDAQSGLMRDAPWHEVLRMIFRDPVLLLLFVGQAAQLFFAATLANWLPSFLTRYYAMPVAQAGLRTGLVILCAGVGMAACGWLIDRLAGGLPRRRMFGAGVLAALMSLAFVNAFSMPVGAAQMALIFCGAFVMSAVIGPLQSAILDIVHKGMRSQASGALTATTNVIGMALGPVIAGALSDRSGLDRSLYLMSYVPLLGLACCVAASLLQRGRDRRSGGQG